jgi:hypothetical protein
MPDNKNQDEYEKIYDEPQKKKEDSDVFQYATGRRKKPRGCDACGGPYPMCKIGCPAFDDD